MKAKEYADKYTATPTDATLTEIAIEFHKETQTLIKNRSVGTVSGFKAIAREMEDKWQAFARRCQPGAINPDGYRVIFEALHPEAAQIIWPTTSK